MVDQEEVKEKISKRKGSLAALIQKVPIVDNKEKKDTEAAQDDHQLKLSDIQPGKYQPRKIFPEDSLQELADSIKTHGVIQPIIVRPLNDGKYEIIAGERRWRAAQLAQLSTIPAIIRAMDDKTVLEFALVENLQREDLSPWEEAEGLQRLKTEFNYSNKEIAAALGKSQDVVGKLLALLKLPECLKALYDKGLTSPEILNELLKAYKENEAETEAFVADKDVISLKEARAFKNREKSKPTEYESTDAPIENDQDNDDSLPANELEDTGGDDHPVEKDDLVLSSNDSIINDNSSLNPDPGSSYQDDNDEDDDGSDFTTQLQPASDGSKQQPFVDTHEVTYPVKLLIVEYQGEEYQLDLTRSCDDKKYCWIFKGEDQLRVLALDLTLITVE